MTYRAFGAAVALGLLLLPATAAADPAVADQLFKRGKALLAEGRIAEACQRFEESFELDPALGAIMNLADCLERDGRVASAYGRWGEAIELAQRRKDDRVEYARTRRDALKPSLSSVTVTVQGAAEGLDVYRGNTKLAPGAYGVALPTDPGEVLVQVVRGDAVLWEQKVVLKESESASVVVDLAEIARVNPPPVKKRVDQKDGGRGGGGAARAGATFWSDQRIAGLVVMGAGVAGAAVGFTFGGLASSEQGEIEAACSATTPPYCTPDGTDAVDRAKLYADVSTFTLIGSGIVAVVGVTVFVTAPFEGAELEDRAGAPGPRVAVSPWLGPAGGGLIVGGMY